MFQHGFPVQLCEDVFKAVKIIPTKTCNNVFIGASEEKIEYLLNGATIDLQNIKGTKYGML